MKVEKRLVVVLSLVVLLLSILNLLVFLFLPVELPGVTGKAVSTSTGTVALCISRPAEITAIPAQSATEGTAFTYQVDTKFYGDNSSFTYFDNTSLFNINGSGYISFTPSTGSAGTDTIEITVQDGSFCAPLNSSTTFTLTISAASSGAAPSGGAGGGGGGKAAGIEEKLFSIALSEDFLKIILRVNQSLEKKISVINDGEVDASIGISNPLGAVVSVAPALLDLAPGQEQELTLLFNPQRKAAPTVYSGLMALRAESSDGRSLLKYITTIVEIESLEVLFDASVDMVQKVYAPGEELKATVTLYNLKRLPTSSVTVLYTILDLHNNVVYEEQEVVSVQEQVSFSKTIPLAKTLAKGQYLFSVKVLSRNSLATATELFEIKEREVPVSPAALVGLAASAGRQQVLFVGLPLFLGLVLIVAVLLLAIHRRAQKTRVETIIKERTIKQKTIVKPRTIIQRRTIVQPRTTVIKQKTIVKPTIITDRTATLRRKLALLQEGYQRGFISEAAYRKGKAQLEKMLRETGG